jgi:hypothetical protein
MKQFILAIFYYYKTFYGALNVNMLTINEVKKG